jgi:prepilin-type N-terminal cleavage/methylation domain-containing protein
LKFEIRNWRFQSGFSLIELLIVIAIFGITASVITASFLNFERNQRLKSAALQLKNDLRLAQNSALSGNKGAVGGICNPTVTNLEILLVGWYVTLDATDGSNDRYIISGDCNVSGAEQPFDTKTILMPTGIKIDSLYFNSDCTPLSFPLPVNVLFEPLKSGVTFHDSRFSPPSFPFYLGDGSYAHQLNVGSPLCMKLKFNTSSYKVVILPSGEINEIKP